MDDCEEAVYGSDALIAPSVSIDTRCVHCWDRIVQPSLPFLQTNRSEKSAIGGGQTFAISNK